MSENKHGYTGNYASYMSFTNDILVNTGFDSVQADIVTRALVTRMRKTLDASESAFTAKLAKKNGSQEIGEKNKAVTMSDCFSNIVRAITWLSEHATKNGIGIGTTKWTLSLALKADVQKWLDKVE